ncbi:MAG: hypothetical protein ACERKD_24245 [Prolixibacteraceae bacterium]
MKNLILILSLVLLISCGKDESGPVTINLLNGVIQKGPFIAGSSVEMSELDKNLDQTGRIFKTEVQSNSGDFQFENLSLDNSYVLLEADGYYYNEAYGVTSESPLLLQAFVDLKATDRVCVNILTHLERDRVSYLMEKGKDFQKAKSQAEKEILKVFQIDNMLDENFEMLDLTQAGNDNGILMAISAIFSVQHRTADLVQLMWDFKMDLKEDGTIDSPPVRRLLINGAILLDTVKSRSFFESYLTDLDLTTSIPPFEKYVENFIRNSDFENSVPKNVHEILSFPESQYGENLLAMDQDTLFLTSGKSYGIKFVHNFEQEVVAQLVFRKDSVAFNLRDYVDFDEDTFLSWLYGASSIEGAIFISPLKNESTDGSLIFKDHGELQLSTSIISLGTFEPVDIIKRDQVIIW